MKDLQMYGTIIPSRGNLMDIGPGTSYKTRILDIYLSGDDHIDIKRKTRHSNEAIMRYIKSFARFVILYEDCFMDQFRMLTGYSPKLLNEYEKLLCKRIQEYVALYSVHNIFDFDIYSKQYPEYFALFASFAVCDLVHRKECESRKDRLNCCFSFSTKSR